MIQKKTKSLEIRVGYPNILTIRSGDQILFVSGLERQAVKVVNVRKYATFDEMVAHEEIGTIMPGLRQEQIVGILRQIYPPEKESLGVVVFEVDPILSEEAVK